MRAEPLVANPPVATSRDPHVVRWYRTLPNCMPNPRLSPGIPESEAPSHCDNSPAGGLETDATMRPFHGVIACTSFPAAPGVALQLMPSQRARRSEEHTSELQ